jgi:hypothetical protein
MTRLSGTYRTAHAYYGQTGTLWPASADWRYTLVCEMPDRISRSARRLTGIGGRDLDAQFFPIARELVN